MCTTLGYVDLEQPLQATWVDIDQSWIPWNIGKKMRPLGHHFTIQEIIPKMAQLICSFFAPKVLEPIPSRLRLLASQGCETEPTSKSWFLGTQNCRDSGQKKWNSKDLYVIYVISKTRKWFDIVCDPFFSGFHLKFVGQVSAASSISQGVGEGVRSRMARYSNHIRITTYQDILQGQMGQKSIPQLFRNSQIDLLK